MEFFKKDTIFIIASHATDYDEIHALHTLCSKIKNNGYDFIIGSHVKIPDHILESSRACIIDQRNKLVPLEGRDLGQRGLFWISTPHFVIESPFFMHGGKPCYTQAHLANVYNCLINALRFGYSYAHFLTYDSTFLIEEISDREREMMVSNYDFVGFEHENRLMGDTWSINLKKIEIEELLVTEQEMEERLSRIQHDDSPYLIKYLLRDLRLHLSEFSYDDYRIGSQVTHTKNKKAEWALFYEDGINLFVQNTVEEKINVSLITAVGTINYEIYPNTFLLEKLYHPDEFGPFLLRIDGQLVRFIDLTSEEVRKFWVESTKFTRI